jgi:hypothetical protein
VADASAFWLERPHLREMQSPASLTWVILNDRRAYFGDIVIETEIVRVEVNGILPTEELTLAARFETFDGESDQAIVSSPARQAIVARPLGALNKLQLYLISKNGECLDELYQDTVRSSRLDRVLGLEQAPIIDHTLADALNRGESETIEFKAFLPLERSGPKSKELLEVVCAFANYRGGHLFIGINDRLEVVGLVERLTRDGRCAPEKAKAEYARGIQRCIREGLTPTLVVEAAWLELAGHDVLHLRVDPSDQCCALVESREIFIRRGASCTKAMPADLELLLRKDALRPPFRIRR